jgi:trigger factor
VKVDVKETGQWKREIFVQLSDEEVREEAKEVLREFRKNARMPGFRKGKVPEAIIEQRFGPSMQKELIERLVPKAYKNALAESELDPLAPGQVRDLEYTKGEPLTFYADLEIRPEIELTDADEFELTRRIFEVPEGELEEAIDALREQQVTYEPVERPAGVGDQINLRLYDITDAEDDPASDDTEVILGAEGLLPEFQEALTGITKGESREVAVSYPEEMDVEELRGSSRHFRVEALEISAKKLPEFDDMFAERLGYANIDEVRTKIRERLEAEEQSRAQRELEGTLIAQTAERNPFDAPEAMIKNVLDAYIRDMGVPDDQQEEFRQSQREGATHLVKRALILGAVARQHEIEVSDDEIEETVKNEIEDQKAAERRLRDARKSGEFERIRHRLRERKAMDFLLEKAEIEEVRGPRPEIPRDPDGE